ncbi:hypothetical protein F511_37709 [Dorcoceras hygrometricum]|uniref:RIN4 pathogenic type III effector avirulence factor Avr cleavage site domain-containing protein n=1 Tax=Dorcoceras hygrometricum TaxID=472368 RepID=A0A2Z7B7V2_9LAMI|nr:hypothetical protein F511_37709 [Dorcoceras hygrometricum]
MEDRKEKIAPWLSVPQFGDWDQKGELPDYSMDFTKIREMRKQNKRDPSRASLGNEEDLVSSATTNSNSAKHNQEYPHTHSPARQRITHRQRQRRQLTAAVKIEETLLQQIRDRRAKRSFFSCFNCRTKA